MAIRLQCFHEFALLGGGYTAKHRAGAHGFGNFFVGIQRCGVHITLCALNARLAGHLADGNGIIAGDDLNGNALFGKVAERFRCFWSDAVGNGQQGHKLQLVSIQPDLGVRLSITASQQQHAAAFFQKRLHLRSKLGIAGTGHKFRCPHHKAALGKGRGAPFVCGIERHHALARPRRAVLFAKALYHGAGGIVIRFSPRVNTMQHGVYPVLRPGIRGQQQRLPSFHPGLGNGTGLVHAQHIHAGQRFNTIHILRQYLALRQPHHTDGEGHTGQQIQPFGDHADQRRHRSFHRIPQRQFQADILL